jgi:branched-chain amino acid aminotransferase
MEQVIFCRGEFIPKSQATVSVFDHGLLYGDGIFEGIRAYQGNVFRLNQHLRRLYDSAKSILLDIPYSLQELSDIVCETLRRNEFQTAYIRLVVTRGAGNLGLDPFLCNRAEVIVIAEQLAMFPKELYEQGIRVVSATTRRNRPDVLSPKVKSLNYLNNILVKIEAHRAGVSEALVLNSEGYVVEGSGENLFLVRDGELWTPPTYLGALEGITRGAVIELASAQGYKVHEVPFMLHDVYVADEVFLTGTAAEIIPVINCDARVIGAGVPGPVTRQLHESYHSITKSDGTAITSPLAIVENV